MSLCLRFHSVISRQLPPDVCLCALLFSGLKWPLPLICDVSCNGPLSLAAQAHHQQAVQQVSQRLHSAADHQTGAQDHHRVHFQPYGHRWTEWSAPRTGDHFLSVGN